MTLLSGDGRLWTHRRKTR